MSDDVRPLKATVSQGESAIPECCNLGVVFRTLVAVNAVVLGAALTRNTGFVAGLARFVESSMVTEFTCLLSLLLLCAVRRLAGALPRAMQRALCALVPALVAAGIVRLLPDAESRAGMPQAMLVAALSGLALAHYFELRLRAFSPVLVEARLQALQARIRPHFLFNSLNAVLSLIRTEPRRAEATLEDLADMFRVLMRDARDLTTMEDELRFCRQYLAIEKIRLGDRLHVEWALDNISDSLIKRAQIPALLLQPLLENAVHYGVEPSSRPATIHIRLARSIDRIELTVTNPYHGRAPGTVSNQMALENIRERLALLYDVEAQLVSRVIGQSYEVRLRFPYVKMPAGVAAKAS